VETAEERAARYEAEAERLRGEAGLTHDPVIRQQLLDIASQYDTLARTVRSLRQ
jgi:hypothetical protein